MNKIIKSLSVIAFVGAVALTMTGAFFSSSGVSENNTFTSGTMDLLLAPASTGTWADNLDTAIWDFTDMAPGETPQEATLWMKNVGSVDGKTMGFAITAATEDQSGFEKQLRITKMTVAGENVLEGGAGADLSNYVAPTNCDVTVDPTVSTLDTIHEGVAAATTGDVVCVKPGTYTSSWETTYGGGDYPVAISIADITLVSLEGPATTTIEVSNNTNAINITANNVTVKGFTITDAWQGINTVGTGIVIRDNIIKNYGGVSGAEGIWVQGGSAEITNNIIQANDSGAANPTYSVDSIYTIGVATVTVSHNTLRNNRFVDNSGTSAGIAVHEGDTVTATYNVFDNNDFGIQVKSKLDSTPIETVTANFNDFLSNNTVNFFYEIDNGTGVGSVFDITNNWWGTMDENEIQQKISSSGPAFVIPMPVYAGGPFIGFVNGNDNNSNHYADLQDLRLYPIVNAPISLAASAEKALIMGVQLDGPTTENIFQGATLSGVNLTVTLQQQ